MARNRLKPCAHPGCSQLVSVGTAYCAMHRKARHSQYKKQRTDDEEQSFYTSKAWRRVRAAKLQQNPLCEECMRQGRVVPAALIHHKIEIKQGGSWLDMENLESLCESCHRKVHAGGGSNP